MANFDVVFFKDSKLKMYKETGERRINTYSLPSIDSVIKKAKEDGNAWGATIFTIHINKTGEFFGAWKKKGTI